MSHFSLAAGALWFLLVVAAAALVVASAVVAVAADSMYCHRCSTAAFARVFVQINVTCASVQCPQHRQGWCRRVVARDLPNSSTGGAC